jgi:hypothetical protein
VVVALGGEMDAIASVANRLGHGASMTKTSRADRDVPTQATSRSAGRRRIVVTAVRAAWTREPGLFAVGTGGLVLAFVCLVGVAVRGRLVPPEGKLLDAATFCFGVGVFTLTVALLLPLAGFSPQGRRRWRRAFYGFAVYGLVLESLQAFRGIDPRFTEEGGPIDVVSGIIFGLTAASNTVLFTILGLRFFRSDVLTNRPVLRLGVRYGAAAVGVSFAVGIGMTVNKGRHIGDHGNLLLSHAIGVHGLQVIPVVALLVAAAHAAPPAKTWLHAAGVGWLVACTAALGQALLGRPPLEASVLSAVIVAGFTLWAAGAAHALLGWRRTAHDSAHQIVRKGPGC